ncbi:nodulation protein NodH [Actibacterium sp. MT2.3-13A]|uniref:nodulation protein NodH n=1 Tax=Actibacterium sp. MT2.3-13A TaxID=2828332 RepID=UPI001BA80915|nr:nodulation protein NodH [Actibacterium sp. MT2.3-13A]
MSDKFDYFVLLAEMRTGSNYLEANLNAVPGLTCHGEAFNPHFIGHHKLHELFGVTLAQREAEPLRLLAAMRENTAGLAGFRFFHDHDPRVLAHVMADPRCAKIILTRNPLDSYVSLKIAGETGQWKLTDMKHQKSARIRFDAAEFEAHLDRLHRFQLELLHGLQTSGQSAFYLAYEDINDLEVLNGLAGWLGGAGRLEALSGKLKKQNPAPLSEKVVNYDEMIGALARIDRFDLTRTPNFEPRRGPSVPDYLAAAEAPLLFMPIPGGPVARVAGWLSALDGGAVPERGFTQKALRQWKRRHPGHRSFTVVSHPVARAHAAYCELATSEAGALRDLRGTLRRAYGVILPAAGDGTAAHRAAFLAFLEFLKGNLGGQTSIRTRAAWATQSAVLQGLSQFHPPDMVMRAERLGEELSLIAGLVGCAPPPLPAAEAVQPVALDAIYDAGIEEAARAVYQRDYMAFGYRAWG